ncbi:Solute carrier family 35 member G1 [Holothuria leucospilota]|uniref:Solute carrier family 35 member G1 n=1 Tax=Holothuria leucospilota TaxID=206669 RepID=A0A9Q1CKF7_HOLLE|nr:Solute carrier family 35 member G1 [Holothuria leucospilota]
MTLEGLKQILYNQRGLYLALLSGVLFATQGLGTNLLTAALISPWSICFYYNLCNVFAIPWVNWKASKTYSISDLALYFLAGAFDTGNFALALQAYSFTTIGNASAILLSKPLWCALLACMLLRETFSLLDAGLVILNLLGVLLISKPPLIFESFTGYHDSDEFWGAMFALWGAISGGFQFVTIRSLVDRGIFDYFLLFVVRCTFGFPIFAVIVCANLDNYMNFHQLSQWIFLAIICLSGLGASLATYAALNSRDAKTVALIATVQVVVAYTFQFLIIGSSIDLLTVVGAVLIILSPVVFIIKSVIVEQNDVI